MKIAILGLLGVLLASCSSQIKEGVEVTESLKEAAQEEAAGADRNGAFYDVSDLGPQVVAFTTEQAAQELARTHTVVYFFTATWCYECQETYRDLRDNAKNIPTNFTLVYVDYDKESALKKKYGVTIQHTFVVVGPSGERQKIWVGTVPIADIVEIATRK